MSKKTACPLDCYDSCSVIVDENTNKLLGDKDDKYTNGYLCPHLNHFSSQKRIESARYKGEEITLDQAQNILKDILQKHSPDKTLFYKGSGNIALMQDVTEHFFAEYGSYSTNGSLCDGAGQVAIKEARGFNQVIAPEEIEKSEVVIFWGRNPHTTNSHILPFIKGKKIIVIDPVETQIAKEADFHLQIRPRGDLYLALLLARFLVIEGIEDSDFLDEHCEEFDDFYELTQGVRIRSVLEMIDVTLGDIGTIIELIRGKKVSILVGVGVQKYRDGADVIRAIDSFGAVLGLHNKEGCGVNFLGDSKYGIASPFATSKKLVSKVDTPFSQFETVFIQGANPLAQMPNSTRVEEEFNDVSNIIYFGLYENETSKIANLVIPAQTFLEKSDVRVSYSNHAILKMNKIFEPSIGISEYQLCRYLCDNFAVELKSENYYVDFFLSHAKEKAGSLEVKNRANIPYLNGFTTDEEKFLFLEELDFDADFTNEFFLITPKSSKSLNSQFIRDEYVYLHESLGFHDDDIVMITSENGSTTFKVKNDSSLREDCVLIYAGTKNLNILTSSKKSLEGNSAVYQESKVKIQKV